MKITDLVVEQAIEYLASTDEAHAKARAEYNALSELRKTVRAFCFTESTGGVKEREMRAECHPDYVAHIEKIKVSEIDFHTMHNKRKRAELTVELYRTYSANVRRGNV
ncbi:MAG: hypothetical protein V3R25_10020 [Nitrosomonadaceae bacterium]